MKTPACGTAALLCLLAGSWATDAAAQQACPKPLGILDSLLVQGKRLEAIDAGQFVVERNGHSIPANIGDPLCENDRMATKPDVTAKLLVGRADGKRHELTMLPGATVVLRAVNRVELALGRLIAAVHGQFDVVLPFARLAATGTIFDVQAGEQAVAVEQLEGETHLTPAGAATAVLNPRTHAEGAAGAAAAVSTIDDARCRELVAQANTIDIAARPALRSRNQIPQVDPASAPAAYDSARQKAVCHDDAQARQVVGRVLADWERPQQAMQELLVGSGTSDPRAHIALGKAMLMRGEPQGALGEFERAGAAGGGAVDVAAGLGDAKRDLGLLAIRSNQLPAAAARFDAARAHYVDGANLAGNDADRGRLLVSLGHLALLRIRLDRESAEARLAEAETFYQRARELGGPPHARLGLARLSVLRALLIPTQQVDVSGMGLGEAIAINGALAFMADQQRKPHWQKAKSELNALLVDSPEFSPAHELMGEILAATGERDAAQKVLKKAIAADPGNTSAYDAIARVLSGGKKAMYEGAYQIVEVPAMRALDVTRRESLIPAIETTTMPPAPLTADMPRLGFARPGATRQVATLTNRSAAAATVSGVAISGEDPSAFRLSSNGCSSVAANASCRIVIDYVAESVGKHRAELVLSFAGMALTLDIALRGEVRPQPEHGGDGPIIL